MSDQPTLDGATYEDLLETCAKAALRDAKAQIAASPRMHRIRTLTPTETTTMAIGATCGAAAMLEELIRRGLIVDRT